MELLDKYIIARWCYAIGEDFIGDVEYTQIHNKLLEDFPDNEYVKRSWSDDPCPIELLEKYNMMHLYRDIQFSHKSESIRSINNEEEFECQFRGLNEESRLSFKLDGFNIQVNYFNGRPISAETRGRTGNSLNANAVLKIVPSKIPLLGCVKVTGETVIPNDKWKLMELETGNKSQRNSVSTALANDMTDYMKFVAFSIQADSAVITEDAYEMLSNFGFETPYYLMVKNYQQLQNGMRIFEKIYNHYNLPNDGLVIENSKYQLAIRLGAWKEESLQSYIVGYEENVGAYGTSMIVNIKPIEFDGATRRQVSVTNIQYILDYDLQIGSPIAFDIRSKTTAVLNTTRTKELHKTYEGRYEEYRIEVDKNANK